MACGVYCIRTGVRVCVLHHYISLPLQAWKLCKAGASVAASLPASEGRGSCDLIDAATSALSVFDNTLLLRRSHAPSRLFHHTLWLAGSSGSQGWCGSVSLLGLCLSQGPEELANSLAHSPARPNRPPNPARAQRAGVNNTTQHYACLLPQVPGTEPAARDLRVMV